MKCFHHPEADAVLECGICGHPLCDACAVNVKGVHYCQDCLQNRLETPAATPPARGPFSVKAAGWLSIVPGLGLVYLGQYLKALVVWLLFMGAIQIAEHSDPGGMLVFLVLVGQIFYAVQEARRLNQARAGQTVVEEPVLPQGKESAIWGGILVGIGSLFLLEQFGMLSFADLFEKFWPLLIIALGIQILLRGRRAGTRMKES